jgi:hypothetical protein
LPQREKFNFAKQTKETVPLEEGRDNFSKRKIIGGSSKTSQTITTKHKKRTPPSSKKQVF